MDKAHIQHPVGLVQDKDLQPGEVQQLLLVEVGQAAGRGHQDIHTPAQPLHLGGLAHAAENDGGAQLQALAVGLKALLDLEGQLPGGGENEGADGPALDGPGVEPLEDWGGKGTGLACTGLGAAQYVPPGEGRRDGLFLDGGGALIPQFGQGPQDGLDKAEFTECHVSRNPLQFILSRAAPRPGTHLRPPDRTSGRRCGKSMIQYITF